MKKSIFLFLLLIVLQACSHVGRLTKPVEELAEAWNETAELARALSEELAVEGRELTQLMDRLPSNRLSSAFIGENYLEEADQLKARLMGHKSAFEELAGEIEVFLDEWSGKATQVDQLETGLTAGELPRDVLRQVRDLSEFRRQGADKIAAWTKEMNDIMEQSRKTEAAYREVLQ
jgi:methyl-accepting chemotaxis protein